jgi:hypothetical protein
MGASETPTCGQLRSSNSPTEHDHSLLGQLQQGEPVSARNRKAWSALDKTPGNASTRTARQVILSLSDTALHVPRIGHVRKADATAAIFPGLNHKGVLITLVGTPVDEHHDLNGQIMQYEVDEPQAAQSSPFVHDAIIRQVPQSTHLRLWKFWSLSIPEPSDRGASRLARCIGRLRSQDVSGLSAEGAADAGRVTRRASGLSDKRHAGDAMKLPNAPAPVPVVGQHVCGARDRSSDQQECPAHCPLFPSVPIVLDSGRYPPDLGSALAVRLVRLRRSASSRKLWNISSAGMRREATTCLQLVERRSSRTRKARVRL